MYSLIGKRIKIEWRDSGYDWPNWILLETAIWAGELWVRLQGCADGSVPYADGPYWYRLSDIGSIQEIPNYDPANHETEWDREGAGE